jgi:hypothetical protein
MLSFRPSRKNIFTNAANQFAATKTIMSQLWGAMGC